MGGRMATVAIEDAENHLSEMIEKLKPGESVVLTRGEIPIARLVAESKPIKAPRKAGSAKGILVILQEDDEHLEHFAEYME